MSSIRPLVTITILVVVGVFLYTKINEGPVHVVPEVNELENAPPAGVPPLAMGSNSSESTAAVPTPAPTWGDGATADGEPTPQWAGNGATSDETAITLPPPTNSPGGTDSAIADAGAEVPSVPAIPELPPLAPAAGANQTAEVPLPETPTIDLPANIPMAQYPGDTTGTDTTTTIPQIPSQTATSSDTNPLRPSAQAISPIPAAAVTPTDADRYGPIAAEPTSEPTFAAVWPAIQGALERQELTQAHEMLSQWYGNPTLSATEAQQVESLLGQLAGTVVYSTEHRLEPPYVVNAGDTLQTIAQRYDVPWQMLAKINGIPSADLIQPGQQLKVVHGPFSAVVELGKSQMTLMLDDRYAGRFPITVEPSATASEGQWVVEQKLLNPATDTAGVVSASYTAPPAAVDRVLVLRNDSPQGDGTTISITSGPASPSGPTAVAPAAIRLSPADAEEVADILSVGSRVTIRR